MLVLNQVSLRRGVKLVLNQASVTLQPGEKVGLVGRNGAGKSSLFSLLAGRLHADAGDFDARPRAQSMLLGLGFALDELDAPVDSFSGGWRMRLQLARALMCPADMMLLDEPTNHLDLDALVWLEAWLQRFAGTMIVISHDREFLDATTRVTVHIDDAKLTRYTGNYTAFEEMRAER